MIDDLSNPRGRLCASCKVAAANLVTSTAYVPSEPDKTRRVVGFDIYDIDACDEGGTRSRAVSCGCPPREEAERVQRGSAINNGNLFEAHHNAITGPAS